MEKRNKITTGKQFEVLISELEKKPSLARGIHRGTTLINTFRQDWEEIAIKLNAHGPPVRNCDGWLRVWRDFKFKLKKKLLRMEAAKNLVAKGKAKNIILFPLEKAAAKFICPENQFSDDNSLLEFQPAIEEIKSESIDETMWEEEEEGFQSESHSVADEIKTEDYGMIDQTLLGEEEYFPSTSTTNTFQVQMLGSPDRKKRKRSRKGDQRQILLKKHNDMQEKVFNEISNSMKELENIFRDSTQQRKKILEVQEKKLKIIQRQHEREEQLFKSEMKLKILEMKMKTKELEALDKQSKS